jgi:hypothetical protein
VDPGEEEREKRESKKGGEDFDDLGFSLLSHVLGPKYE